MVGRPKKPQTTIFRNFEIETLDGDTKKLKEIMICCLVCHSSHIREYGTRKRGKTRVQTYQCNNPSCSFLNQAKQGK